ncbi:hypothetical protein [Flaviflexus massiliensis]|uniref:hypothetical protein n=1 Tax=Flaviflexus massiliensis TaxID=1522309 RepID=UPI0006D557AD|nr:hypothetical protein [Flaviflexus massiliensis]
MSYAPQQQGYPNGQGPVHNPFQPYPVYQQPNTAGRLMGILSIVFFWTGSIGCALGFVSISQARRSGASATLGIIGFVLGLAVFIGILAYVFFGVLDVWEIL